MRTLEDAERDYDKALEDGARAVAALCEKHGREMREARRVLNAVVLAAGGDVRVPHSSMVRCNDCVLTVSDDAETGGIRLTVNYKL